MALLELTGHKILVSINLPCVLLDTGAKVKVFEDGEWNISRHHSSVTPDSNKPQAINEA